MPFLLNRFVKRTFDVLFSALGLLVFMPLFFIRVLKIEKIKKVEFWGKDSKKINGYIFPYSSNNFIRSVPLLWTVLVGNISFVGGPLVYSDNSNPILSNKPGLTGIYRLKNINHNDEFYRQAEYYYLQNQGILLDLELLLKTLVLYK